MPALPLSHQLGLLAQAGESPAPEFGLSLPMMIVIIFGIMYFLIIRPAKREETDRKRMLDGLQKNDRVVISGGILGIVTNVKDDEVAVRIDDTNNTRVRVQRSAISAVLKDGKEGGSSKTS